MHDSQSINAIIIDDEKRGRETLAEQIRLSCPEVAITGEASGVKEGVTLVESEKPDLVFLDIMMGDGSGFDFLEQCRYKDFEVIFVTAHENFALKAFEYSAVHYLLKPVDEDLLCQAVQKIASDKGSKHLSEKLDVLLSNKKQLKKLAIPTSSGVEIAPIEDIYHLEASGNYTYIHLRDSSILSSKTLKEFDSILSGSSFFRIHKSYLINMEKVVRYVQGDGGHVVIENGCEIEIARRRKDAFLKALMAN